jgi:excinuclease UvrABC nuclease subunit
MANPLLDRLTRLSTLVQEYLPEDSETIQEEGSPMETASLVLILTDSAQQAIAELHAQEAQLCSRFQQQRAARIRTQLEALLQRAERLAERLEDLSPGLQTER